MTISGCDILSISLQNEHHALSISYSFRSLYDIGIQQFGCIYIATKSKQKFEICSHRSIRQRGAYFFDLPTIRMKMLNISTANDKQLCARARTTPPHRTKVYICF